MTRIHNRRELIHIRRGLRSESTAAEAALWSLLRKRALDGFKFRRQHSVGPNMVLDFYCPERRLAIELDGAGHMDALGQVNDGARDESLLALGIRVLRIENQELLSDPEGVLQMIRAMLVDRSGP
ncbi:MAG: endonuclease domain-containing protein [Flavobacteriales bacterium]|nr:endonuclease domain-containing protein [Flavobacteriales bacterium]